MFSGFTIAGMASAASVFVGAIITAALTVAGFKVGKRVLGFTLSRLGRS